MDRDKGIASLGAEILSLAAETLALQAVCTQVLLQLRQQSPSLDLAVRRAIDEAASQLEHHAIRLGKAARPEYTIKALRIVEKLREALGYKDKPRGLV
jgi:hypothetical protein